MMNMRVVATILAAAAALAVAAPAQASVTVVNYAFSSGLSGTMALNLDSTQPFASAYTLNSLDLSLGGATFTPGNSTFLFDSGTNYRLSGSSSGTSYSLLFNPALQEQAFGFGTLTQVAGAGAVPEPATWAMMLLGFGAIGFAARRRRAAKAIAA